MIKIKITAKTPITRVDNLPKGTGKVLDVQNAATSLLKYIDAGEYEHAQLLLSNIAGSKKVAPAVRKEFAILANTVTSVVEAKALLDEEVPLGVASKIRKGVLANLKLLGDTDTEIASRPKEKTRAEKALEVAEQLFASPFTAPQGPEATKLKRHLADRGLSVGQAPIVFILNGGISVPQLKLHFAGVEQSAGYLVMDGLNVLGVSHKFVEERGFASLKDGLELMASTWNAKNANRYHIFDTYASWGDALWALAILKSDVRILNQAAGGRFRFRKWGLAFNT